MGNWKVNANLIRGGTTMFSEYQYSIPGHTSSPSVFQFFRDINTTMYNKNDTRIINLMAPHFWEVGPPTQTKFAKCKQQRTNSSPPSNLFILTYLIRMKLLEFVVLFCQFQNENFDNKTRLATSTRMPMLTACKKEVPGREQSCVSAINSNSDVTENFRRERFFGRLKEIKNLWPKIFVLTQLLTLLRPRVR